ncbi:MAG TPA: hypothetical protein VEF72_22265 [Mycobacterium sp.]|nr:hypothetical protein [Mycobacterium sp.]
MTVKLLATSVAAVAAIGAAAASVTTVAAGMTSTNPAAFQVQPVVLGVPLPLDPPAPNLPTADELTDILTNLADPGVSYTKKNVLVQGGISPGEGHGVDHELRKAARDGDLPLSFNVTNIQPAGPNAASADVAISGPKLPAPVTKNLTFINQGGWVLSQDSAMALVQAATAH